MYAHDPSPRQEERTHSSGIAASALTLSLAGLAVGLVNWLWAFTDAMHGRALLLTVACLGAAIGAAAGLVIGAIRHLAGPRLGGPRSAAVPHALSWGIIGPIALGASLGIAMQLRSIPHGRLMGLIGVIASLVGVEWICLALGRMMDRRFAPGGAFRRAVMAAGLVAAAAAMIAVGIAMAAPLPTAAAEAPPAAPANPSLPNIILVSFDTLRPDHLSSLGYGRPTSPAIDRVIAEGALFSQTIAASTWTVLSNAAIHTGRSPSRIGPSLLVSAASGGLRVPDEARTLAEILRENGYRTAGFIGGATLRSTFGFHQGFETYDDMLPPSLQVAAEFMFFAPQVRTLLDVRRQDFLLTLDPLYVGLCNLLYDQGHQAPPGAYLRYGGHPKRFWNTAAEVNAKVRAYLPRRPDGPQFLFVHYFDLHSPYDAEPPYFGKWGNDGAGMGYIMGSGLLRQVMGEGRVLTDREKELLIGSYDEEIAQLDAAFGDLMETLRAEGLLDDALVVLYSDHGESFGEHGDLFHGHSLDEELLRILFAVRRTGVVPPGTRIDYQVRAVDILPTVLDLAGLGPRVEPAAAGAAAAGSPGAPEGISLAPLIRDGGAPTEPTAAFSEVYGLALRDASFGSFALDQFAIRQDGWKLVRSSDGTSRLYHVAADPGERRDLQADQADLARRMGRSLDEWLAGRYKKDDQGTIETRALEELKGLGYIDSDAAAPSR